MAMLKSEYALEQYSVFCIYLGEAVNAHLESLSWAANCA